MWGADGSEHRRHVGCAAPFREEFCLDCVEPERADRRARRRRPGRGVPTQPGGEIRLALRSGVAHRHSRAVAGGEAAPRPRVCRVYSRRSPRLYRRPLLVRRTDQQHRFVWAAPDATGSRPAPSRKAHNEMPPVSPSQSLARSRYFGATLRGPAARVFKFRAPLRLLAQQEPAACEEGRSRQGSRKARAR